MNDRRTLINERRSRVLTEHDIAALRDTFEELFTEHRCKFSSEEFQIVKDFIAIYKETRHMLIKFLIGLLLISILVLFILGLKHNIIDVKAPIVKIGG